MRLRYQDDFKRGYLKIKGKVANPASFNKNLHIAAELLRSKQDLSGKFVTNRIIPAGTGWYESYIYTEKKLVVILQYKIEGEYITLSQIGDEKDLMKSRRIFMSQKD